MGKAGKEKEVVGWVEQEEGRGGDDIKWCVEQGRRGNPSTLLRKEGDGPPTTLLLS